MGSILYIPVKLCMYVHIIHTYITECLIDKIFCYYENVLAFIIKTKGKFHSTVFISFISAIYQ